MTETNARSTINFFSVIGVFMYLACSVGQLGGIQVRQIVTAYPWLSISILLIFTQTLADQGYKEMSIYVGLVPVHQIISFIRYSLANSALLCFALKKRLFYESDVWNTKTNAVVQFLKMKMLLTLRKQINIHMYTLNVKNHFKIIYVGFINHIKHQKSQKTYIW